MGILTVILLVLSAAVWFCYNEHDRVFGVYYPTSAVRQSFFPIIVVLAISAGVVLSKQAGISDVVSNSFGLTQISSDSAFIMLLASFVCLGVMKFFSVAGSMVFALVGALAAYVLSVGSRVPDVKIALSFFLAPVMTIIISAILTKLQKTIFGRLKLHLITLSYYMRNILILGVVLTSLALGLNWGGFITGFAETLTGGQQVVIYTLIVISILTFSKIRSRYESEGESAGIFADFSIYAVVSVGFAVALTLIVFSFDVTTSAIGLCAVPLPVSALTIAAIGGVELAQKSELIDRTEYVKEIVAFVAAPVATFLVTYLFLYVTGMDVQNTWDDFAVIGAAIVILLALSFAGYVRRQVRQHEIKDKLVYTQQQQIYEHSRALNDMELKVVISENQALHNAVEMKKQEVMNVALSIVEQREYLESLSEIVNSLAKAEDSKEKDKLIAELKSSLKQRLSHDREVDSQYFYAQAESLHEDFNAKLAENFPDLTQQETRLATMLRLGFSSKYIATLMNITPKSVEISRYRLRQKLGLSRGDNLVNFIKSI